MYSYAVFIIPKLQCILYHRLTSYNMCFILQGGVYLVNLLNVYGPGLAILFVVFVEAAGVCWIYGVDRFSSDIECMLGHRPGLFWRLCWGYISPVFLLVSDLYTVLDIVEILVDKDERELVGQATRLDVV